MRFLWVHIGGAEDAFLPTKWCTRQTCSTSETDKLVVHKTAMSMCV